MKKILLISMILCAITGLASCDYDDCNDIDILTPNDSTETNVELKDVPD